MSLPDYLLFNGLCIHQINELFHCFNKRTISLIDQQGQGLSQSVHCWCRRWRATPSPRWATWRRSPAWAPPCWSSTTGSGTRPTTWCRRQRTGLSSWRPTWWSLLTRPGATVLRTRSLCRSPGVGSLTARRTTPATAVISTTLRVRERKYRFYKDNMMWRERIW